MENGTCPASRALPEPGDQEFTNAARGAEEEGLNTELTKHRGVAPAFFAAVVIL